MTKEFLVPTLDDFAPVFDVLLADDYSSTLLIALHGDLGAGKTAFTQQLAKYLGVAETVTSPTFTIMKQYVLPGGLFNQLIHIDAYRFEAESEAKPLRLERVFIQPHTVVCVEWPERIEGLIPKQAVHIHIAVNPDQSRTVRVDLPLSK